MWVKRYHKTMCLECPQKLVELLERLALRGVFGRLPKYRALDKKYTQPNSLALWSVLIRVCNETLIKEFRDKRILDKSFESFTKGNSPLLWPLRRVKFCSIKVFFGKVRGVFLLTLASSIEFWSFVAKRLHSSSPKPSGHDPPKGFVPLPKIETGGCARSDSLVRSLIF